jgi:hypothetical protein
MGTLAETEIRALNEALDDEHRAWATYDQVIADFGEVRPFSNIREAEARHIEALSVLFARYGLPMPENPWPGRVARYASLQAACEAGVAAEIENGALYERLLASTSVGRSHGVPRPAGGAAASPAGFRRCAAWHRCWRRPPALRPEKPR